MKIILGDSSGNESFSRVTTFLKRNSFINYYMKGFDSYRTTEMTQKVHIGKHLHECKVGKGFLGKAYKVQTFSKKN